MTDPQKWQAVAENNAACDGRVFYAVRSTGIFCRLSCKSKQPVKANVAFFYRVFHKYTGLSPGAYRKKFHTGRESA